MKKGWQIILGFCVALWLVAASFMWVLSPNVTHTMAGRTVNTQLSGLDRDYLVHIADETLAFSLGDENADLPIGTDDRVAFTPEILSHLRDVRVVFQGAIVFAVVMTVAVIALMVVNGRKGGRRPIGRALVGGSLGAVATVTLLAVIGIMNFNALFAAMHKLFFADGTWTFANDSLLICALPQPFWMMCALTWAVALVILCVAALIVGLVLRRKKNYFTKSDTAPASR
jgi:integral membrane protein (TIGR01906 family)